MKHITIATGSGMARMALGIFCLAATTLSCAANMVEMQVVSVITPAACTPMLSGGGVADYGIIPARSLKPGTVTPLPSKSLSFSINCDAAAKVSIRAIDNRTNSVIVGIIAAGSGDGNLNDSFNFGLGTAAGKSIGGYAIVFQPASYTGDYQQTQLLYSTDSGTTWQPSTTGYVAKNRSFGWGAQGSSHVSSLRTISGTVTVQPYINKPESLSLSQEILLDGSATLELSYL
ncbi:DUF1120 domain-containing protein [Herbaspirillum lusitanum]|uniref:DUF1120 domain-containing protein n=2 Tax=Herbaspirillum lusitanum TaxID=213312 RepID=UPI0022372B5D|nr:DUF1120 domain-containing protein [Herbaspirillum lusitanum]